MKHLTIIGFLLITILFLITGFCVRSFAGSGTGTMRSETINQPGAEKNSSTTPRLDTGVKSEVKKSLRFKPDLTIKQMKIWPANPTTLDTIRFSAYIKNTKISTAPPSKAGIKIGGETYPVLFSKPSIGSGGSVAVVRLKNLSKSGTYGVKFIADVNNDVDESNENNNTGSLKFTVTAPPLPDLTITDMTNNSSNCLVYTIKNIGGPIPESVNLNTIGIRFTKGGIIGYSVSNLGIIDPGCSLCQPNGVVTATKCHPGLTTGPWFDNIHAKIEVDYTDKLEESNESNNTMEENSLH